ncbi:MAG: hypothetical protein KJN92_00775, partial [Gemmatimonadetes bacterium]|nr:hypothetical protein [Gemmatimonadota bacterium]
MFTLSTLGSLDLLDPAGKEVTAVLSQPKRFGLLLFLALAQPRGLHRRDTLLTHFWPERDEAHARNALSQALSFLRQNLAEELIAGRGTEEVGLTPNLIQTDVEEFESAITDGRWAEALDLYRGDFLRGFHVGGAWGFEEWVDGERERLKQAAAGAAWTLAREQVERGALLEAERAARRALRYSFADETAVRGFIDALAEAGDRAAALSFFEDYCATLRRELELEPSPQTLEVAESIRNGRPDSVDVQPDTSPITQPAEFSGTPPMRSSVVPWLVGSGLLVAIAAGTFLANRTGTSGDLAPRIGIFPSTDLSPDSADAYFAGGVPDEFSTKLHMVPNLRLVSLTPLASYRGGEPSALLSEAKRQNLDFYLESSAGLMGDTAKIIVRLTDVRRDEQVWLGDFSTGFSAQSLVSVMDSIAQQVAYLVGVELAPEEREKISRVLTTSDEAYRLYLRGNYAFQVERQAGQSNDPRFNASVQYYLQATALDPGFEAAQARLALAHTYGFRTEDDESGRVMRLAQRAVEMMPRLPEAHLALARALWREGLREPAKDRLAIARSLAPDHPRLAEQGGVWKRAEGDLAGAIADYEEAFDRNPTGATLIRNLEYTYLFAHRWEDAERMNRRLIPLTDTVRTRMPWMRQIYMHLARGQHAEAEQAIAEMLLSSHPQLFYGVLNLGEFRVAERLLTPDQARVAFAPILAGAPNVDSTSFLLRGHHLESAHYQQALGDDAAAKEHWAGLKAWME